MENHHFSWENPLLMAIFNSYVKLPEGIKDHWMVKTIPPRRPTLVIYPGDPRL